MEAPELGGDGLHGVFLVSSSGRSQTAANSATLAITKSKPMDILLVLISRSFPLGVIDFL
jgi:hypothetical protein